MTPAGNSSHEKEASAHRRAPPQIALPAAASAPATFVRVAGARRAKMACVGGGASLTEHVGRGRLPEYFAFLHGEVRPQGRLLNHAITSGPGRRLPT